MLTTSVATNGEWPGVGKICEPGAGGTSSVRGVSDKTIRIAVFNDAANTVEPGLEEELVQQAMAFAAWCNASGGINGRDIVIDDRDAALFNPAQVTVQACQSDFMAVGGGMALDQPSVPIREQCGLGQISGYLASDASEVASDQVDPGGGNTDTWPSGWFRELAKAYPQAVKKAGMGGANTPSVLEPERKYEFCVEAQGWKVVDFQQPPIAVTDWAPYVDEAQSKGVEALWPSLDDNIVPYFQAMTTARFHPAFVILGVQFYNSTTSSGVAANPGLPPVYLETSWWPLEMASQNPSTEQLVKVMHTYAKGDAVDFDDEEGAESWLLVGQVRLGLWHRSDGVMRPEPRRRHRELGRWGYSGPDSELQPVQPGPSAVAMFRTAQGRAQQVRLRQGAHPADPIHLELQSEERRAISHRRSCNNCRPCDVQFGGPDLGDSSRPRPASTSTLGRKTESKVR